MSSSPFSKSAARELRDARAALRQGDAVIVRRLHPSVIQGVAAAIARANSVPLLRTKPSASTWEKVDHFARLSRDAVRLTAAVAGIAAAVWLSGEQITPIALAMLSLLPAIVILAKSGENTAYFQAIRTDARRAEKFRHSNEARRRWLITVDRASRLLIRSLNRPHALYETPSFGVRGRVMRRRAVDAETIARLNESLLKARKVEDVVAETERPRGVSLAAVVANGWSDNAYFWRRILIASALAAVVNSLLLAIGGRPVAGVIAGLAGSILLGIRYAICARETARVEATVQRDLLRLRYPDLMRELDTLIQAEVDHLIGLYSAGLDVTIDPFADLEPQLRSQLDDAIVVAEKSEIEISDVVDLRPLREQFRPSAN